MAKRHRGQSERRRKKKQRSRKAAEPGPGRPKAWAEAELAGIEGYVARLESPAARDLPAKWVQGQLKHYRARAEKIRAELRAWEGATHE